MCLWVPEGFLTRLGNRTRSLTVSARTARPARNAVTAQTGCCQFRSDRDRRGRTGKSVRQTVSVEQRFELREALAVGLEGAIDRVRGTHIDAGDPQEIEGILPGAATEEFEVVRGGGLAAL
ncbi:hypothetical protein HTG_14675 [Natrinema mahii]|nr:hypothetical protein HTG_14675 [Natrinema mahii]